MYLFLSIILAIGIGFILIYLDPVIGGLLAFGLVTGCLFRALYLLNGIYNGVQRLSPEEDQVERALREHKENKKAPF